ncbi:MAG TPA: metallophosphoesterase family protein [Ktedonobacterales bacterium]|nr:metallophosphoesterase family protein [Ktedonobacterales bacterium]
MRIALLSDIHGNPLALDAVLGDIATQGPVDAYWMLGDFAGLGYDPATVIERALALPNVRFVRGNHDRYMVSGEGWHPSLEDAHKDPEKVRLYASFAASFGWAKGYVTAAGQLDWLAHLPLEQRETLPDGTRLLGVHAAPGTDDGDGIHPKITDDALRAAARQAEADLIVVGHTHVPLDRSVDDVRFFNLGSVSNPLTPDWRASYGLLDAGPAGYSLKLRRVEYDREAAIAAIERSGHPQAPALVRFLEGKMLSPWLREPVSQGSS